MFATSLALLAQEFHGPRARHRVRDLGRDDGRRGRRRPARRRRADERARLAVDLLPQPPDRDRDARDHAAQACPSRATRTPARIDWLGLVDVQRGAVPARLRAHPRATTRAGAARVIVGMLVGVGASCSSLFVVVERRVSAPDVRPRRCFASRRSAAPRSPPSRCRRRCSRCSSTSRSTCRRSSATGRCETGLRFLPSRCCRSSPRRSSGKLTARLPARGLLGGGLLLVGVGPAAHARRRRAARTGPRCCRASSSRASGSATINPSIANAAIGVVAPARAGHGVGDQLDVSPGRDRDRASPASARSSRARSTSRLVNCARGHAGRRARRTRSAARSPPAARRRRSRRRRRRRARALEHAIDVAFTAALNDLLLDRARSSRSSAACSRSRSCAAATSSASPPRPPRAAAGARRGPNRRPGGPPRPASGVWRQCHARRHIAAQTPRSARVITPTRPPRRARAGAPTAAR